jgi:hypothetical protein
VGTTMTLGALGLDVKGAVSETDQYLINQATTNINLAPNQSVVPQDMKGH